MGPYELYQLVRVLQFAFCTILYLEAGPLPPLDHGNMFRLMIGTLLMQATHLPCKLMVGMCLRFAHCAARNTPPHFVVNVMKLNAQSVFIHTIMRMNLMVRHNTCHFCCAKGIRRFGLLLEAL